MIWTSHLIFMISHIFRANRSIVEKLESKGFRLTFSTCRKIATFKNSKGKIITINSDIPINHIYLNRLDSFLEANNNIPSDTLIHHYDKYNYWIIPGTPYFAMCPDLPGCMICGANQKLIEENILKAKVHWLRIAKVYEIPIPKPGNYYAMNTHLTLNLSKNLMPLLHLKKSADIMPFCQSILKDYIDHTI